jgi:DNA polymerase III delta prime subunit
MMPFPDYLVERLAAGGYTTEDALAAVLPLIRQVVGVHRAGLVAPLEGVNAVFAESNRLWFEEARAGQPRNASARLRELQRPASHGVDVIGLYQVDMQVEEGTDQVVSMQIGRREDAITRPVYLPGYVSWEHQIGHHDPLTDVFVLGLILAACAVGLDLNDPDDLASFVRHRRNLFELNPQVHPVLAKAITRMTELYRRRRPQDLAVLLGTLENYRDQNVDFDFDLTRTPTFATADRRGKRAAILSCLQQRLFDISRRNRLLSFRATAQAVNLTWASVPLSFDVENVRPGQIVTWGGPLKDAITAGGPVSLNKYLRFDEALYLPGQLDEIRNEARRDQTEFGFAQLRLVVAFLRWTNLKEKPPERYDSPLVLLPVRLTKTKGVRDVFMLEPLGTEAEFNPVLRFYLKQLYAVDLPESIDLATGSLDDLHAHIAATVQASEPAVTVEKIDQPRINLLVAKARRRLDQYRRRVRLSGRGVRSFLNIDYSYARENYHPLGLRLFQTRIAPAEPRLRTLAEETPRPRTHVAPVEPPPAEERQRRLYSQAEPETNPFHWEFDLCNVTLANFHYRKMSLVRDYSLLQEANQAHTGFDTIFSLEPREKLAEPPPLQLEESYPIVNCDPTQASAVALARTGKHFIIQGPPGTGKSQTITNLIADFVAVGKRVLFVCEKRAAIDVVYHRLRQAGLHELCCLIHDAQDDKREFISDLKTTYETFLAAKEDHAARSENERGRLIDRLNSELAPLARYDAAMRATPASAGVPLLHLYRRAIALDGQAADLSPRERERLPAYRSWHDSAASVDRLSELLPVVQSDGILAGHPLRRLHGRLSHADRPLEALHDALPKIDDLTDRLRRELMALGLPAESWSSLARLRRLVEYAESLEFLAAHDLLGLLAAKSEATKRLASWRKKLATKEKGLTAARTATTGWREKLSPEDTTSALEQMRRQENLISRVFAPSWWRLRGILRRRYDFASHQVRPSYTHVLEQLRREHEIVAEAEKLVDEAREEFFFHGSFAEFSGRVAALAEQAANLPTFLLAVHQDVIQSPRGAEAVQELASLKPVLSRLTDELNAVLVDTDDLSLEQLRDETSRIDGSLDSLPDFVPCLKELSAMPELADAWRRLPLRAEALERAIAGQTVDDLVRADPYLARFNSGVQTAHVSKLERLHDDWQSANATTVRDRQCRQFLDHVRIASLPHAQLTQEQKEFKVKYNRGRRELEHEFSKTMRFRSIRDLVAGDPGLVLQDLKPVWLMSPLSVSDALPLAGCFDVVIFDEASQVTLEEAVPAIFRASQVLVVGDAMQLPPTSFFASKADDDERLVVEDPSGQEVEYDLSGDSLLNHAARSLPATMLGWHYRSRSESLISFSNAAFYQGRLLTVPDVALSGRTGEIIVNAAGDGFSAVERLLERPVSFHFCETGVYDQRRNSTEADYIAQLVRGLFTVQKSPSIGIVAFSEAQQSEIEHALQHLASADDGFRGRLEAEREREEDGQFAGLLVKNLENIQGDERDVIILSVCYAPGPNGKMLMNFGPINQNGGERRLNVAFSRAKKHMAVISSIRQHAITNDYNDGARALKNYLRYAEACSSGDTPSARRVLWEINAAEATASRAAPVDIVVQQVAARLRQRGYEVETDVGQSDFRCDLAVRVPGERYYRLGILVDTDRYYRNANLMERDVLRPRLLRAFGWNVVPLITKNWFEDADEVLESLDQRIRASVALPP